MSGRCCLCGRKLGYEPPDHNDVYECGFCQEYLHTKEEGEAYGRISRRRIIELLSGLKNREIKKLSVRNVREFFRKREYYITKEEARDYILVAEAVLGEWLYFKKK